MRCSHFIGFSSLYEIDWRTNRFADQIQRQQFFDCPMKTIIAQYLKPLADFLCRSDTVNYDQYQPLAPRQAVAFPHDFIASFFRALINGCELDHGYPPESL